jgi:HAMP domain-containing protein
MKKFFTGVVCGAAILAAAVVFLPVTAVKVAKLLSKPQDRLKRHVPDVERNQFTTEFLKESYTEKGS